MKTLAELKEMNFIPHHDCGCSEGHYDSWQEAFEWYNTVFEKESVSAIQDEWAREMMLDAAKKEEG